MDGMGWDGISMLIINEGKLVAVGFPEWLIKQQTHAFASVT